MSTTTGNREKLDALLPRLCEEVAAAEPRLTALDEATGDGDFGSNLDEGLRRAAERARQGEAGWAALVATFLDEVGGTSGPLFGLLFAAIGRAADTDQPYLAGLGQGLADGVAAIQRVGEAEVGDRTLVDALAPAVAAGGTHPEDAHHVGEVAVDAALATADLRARRGRSSYIGDKALGQPDPGAIGAALVLTVLLEPAGDPASLAELRDRLLSV
jgi:dihydroxyacetone kinase-like protein